MSTDERDQLAAQLRETERGEAAAWLTYPPSPWWWPFLFGAWTFAYAGSIGWLEGLAQAGATFALALVMIGVIAWERRRRGAWPSGHAPREIRRLMTGLFGGAAVVALVAWLVGETVGVLPAALLAAGAVTALVWWYGTAYDRAAAEVRERLA
ncbi:hypothetical protein [Nocardioides marmoraquaticus]